VIRSRTLLAWLICLVAAAAFPAAGFAQTAGQAEYGGIAGADATSPTAAAGTAPSGTAGVADQGSTPTAKATPAETAQIADKSDNGTLPFTGQDILLMLLAGAGLVGLGLALRAAAGRAPAGA
jgi:hypothetical protein